MVEEKNGMRNDIVDQNEALREPSSLAIGEYSALRKLAIAVVARKMNLERKRWDRALRYTRDI
jgi:hypothetical protein